LLDADACDTMNGYTNKTKDIHNRLAVLVSFESKSPGPAKGQIMTDFNDTELPTVDPEWGRTIDRLCKQFEMACKESLQEGTVPSIGEYLAKVPSTLHRHLQQQLEGIQQEQRRQSTEGGSRPVTVNAARSSSGRQPVTIDGAATEPERNLGAGADQGARLWPQVPGYQIVAELGRGGMGVVYKARHEGLNRWTALKMMLGGAHAGAEQLTRFHTEAEAVALLQHPNIVQIYEVGEHDGLPYLALEFVDGGSLDKWVHRQPQPFRDAAYLIETLAGAMQHAHEHGVIHRDLKPANVLLRADPENGDATPKTRVASPFSGSALSATGLPKITDFGLAKRLQQDSSQTKSGMLMGTPSYMAPEQARGEVHEIGPLADVYSLGAMLYELLTGRPPFQAATVMDTVVQVTSIEPMAPTRLVPKLPRDLETICLKCLQKDKAKRYASAGALAEDLGRFLAGEPIRARPVGPVERLGLWCRRNPRVAGLSAAIVVLLLAVTGISLASYLQIKQEKAETDRQYMRAEENARLQEAARQLADQRAREAEQAEKKAADNARIAGDQRKLALETLYSLVTKVEDQLRDKHDMADLRKEILQSAMDGLGKVSRTIESAAIADRSMGVALQRMGDICEQAGETEQAVQLFQQSLRIFDKLEANEPPNDWIPWNQAVSFDKLGSLSREFQGDAAAALDYYRKSLRLRQALLTKIVTPEIPPFRRKIGLIVSYVKLAAFELAQGDPAAAHQYAAHALEESDALLASTPGDRTTMTFQAMSLYLLGGIQAHEGAVETARKDLARCVALRRKASEDDATNASAKRELGAAYEALGDLEVEQGNGTAAQEQYRHALELYQELVRKEPKNAENQWRLGHICYRLGTASHLLHDAATARSQFSESVKIRENLVRTDPRNVQFATELMLAQARVGQHGAASKIAGRLRQRASRSPEVLFAIACGYALCSQMATEDETLREQYRDSAIEVLGQALSLGYRDAAALRLDPNLETLRQLERFQALVRKAEKE
jgi:serine/threonine-protein kinase